MGWWNESPRGRKGLGRIWLNSVEMRRIPHRQSCLWILVSYFILPSSSRFKMLTIFACISVYRKALFTQSSCCQMKNVFISLRGDEGYSPKEQCLYKPTPTLGAICGPVALAFYKATWCFLSPCRNGTAISAAQILSSIFVLPSKCRKLLSPTLCVLV